MPSRFFAVLFALGLFVALIGPTRAATAVLDPAADLVNLSGTLEILRDPSGALTVDDIVEADRAGRFRPIARDVAEGYTHDVVWVKMAIRRMPDAVADRLVEVGLPYLDHVDLYSPDGRGGLDVVKTGAATPFATRPVPYRDFVFPVSLPADQTQIFYLRLQSHTTIAAKIRVFTESGFFSCSSEEQLLLGLLHGSLVFVILMSLAQFYFTKDKIFLIYFIYDLACEIMYICNNGYIGEYIFQDSPWISYNLLQLMICVSFSAGAIFLTRLTDMRRRNPWLNKFYLFTAWAAATAIIPVLFGEYGAVAPYLQILMTLLILSSMIINVSRALRGDRVSATFSLAFMVLFSAILVVNMRSFGLIDVPIIADWAQQLGNTLHMLVLSMGMAQRITLIERERNEAQQALLMVAQRHERDLGERVASRTAALSESEDRFRTLSEATTEAIVLHADGIVLDGNPRMASMFGFADDRVMAGVTVESLFVADCQATLPAVATQGDRVPQSCTGMRRDGTGFPLELHSKAATKEGRPILVTTIRDLTQNHLMEARLLNTAAEAQAASRAKSDFLAMMSHEIRTPLHGILGLTHLLEQSDIDEAQAEYLHTIQSSGEALMNILNDVLDFSKMEAGSLRIVEAPFQLRSTLDVVANLLRAKAEEKGLELVVDVDGRTPDLLIGDAYRLRQVLLNLLGNAIKFTNSGRVALTVQALDSEPESAALEIAVSDTGIGIPQEAQASLFQAFIQAHMGASHGGTGLGLAICRRIVEAQGGRLGLESSPDKGSRFWFRLHYRSNAEPALVPPDLPKDHLGAPIGSLTILLVEDNVVNRTIAQAILERRGHKVVTATDGHEAVAFAASEEADQVSVILMDMHMPGMDGLDATRTIRAMAASIAGLPIIGLTAATMSDEVQSCLDAGMNEVIAKPFKPVTLCAVVEKWSRVDERVRNAG